MGDKYKARLEEGIERLLKESKAIESSAKEWVFETEGDGIKIYIQQGKPADRFVATCVFDAGFEEVCDACYDLDRRKTWDTTLTADSRVVEEFPNEVSITLVRVDGKFGVSSREMLNARLKKVVGDKKVFFFLT